MIRRPPRSPLFPYTTLSRSQQLPWTAAHQKLLTAFAGEATPDLCQLGNTWIPEFVALKALEPLDQSLARSTSVTNSDRKSTRLNSSHSQISYAVFCLKKKKN